MKVYDCCIGENMRILLISDIHANIYALEAIERAEKWDEVWCCGDLVDFGPFPAETVAWVRDHNAKVVMGNHDMAVLSLTDAICEQAYEERHWTWGKHNYQRLNGSAREYLMSLPKTLILQADGYVYQMQHQYDSGYGTIQTLDQFDKFWSNPDMAMGSRRLLFGHTHRRGVHVLGENEQWLNPGSVSYRRPDDPDKRAHYMMIEDGVVRFGALEYNRAPLLNETYAIHHAGRMIDTNLQDAFFFFGNAATTREPLPDKNG